MGDTTKKKLMIYISEEASEQLRELEFYKRMKRSSLIEEMIAEAYHRWEKEEASQPKRKAKA